MKKGYWECKIHATTGASQETTAKPMHSSELSVALQEEVENSLRKDILL